MKFILLKRAVLWPLRRWFPPEDRSVDPPPCDPELREKGTLVGVWAPTHPTETFRRGPLEGDLKKSLGKWAVEDDVRAVNRMIKRAAKRGAHGFARIDWSYAGGRVVVRAIGNRVAISLAGRALEARWGGSDFGAIEDFPTCDTSCGKRWMPGSCDPDCPHAPVEVTDGQDGVMF